MTLSNAQWVANTNIITYLLLDWYPLWRNDRLRIWNSTMDSNFASCTHYETSSTWSFSARWSGATIGNSKQLTNHSHNDKNNYHVIRFRSLHLHYYFLGFWNYALEWSHVELSGVCCRWRQWKELMIRPNENEVWLHFYSTNIYIANAKTLVIWYFCVSCCLDFFGSVFVIQK